MSCNLSEDGKAFFFAIFALLPNSCVYSSVIHAVELNFNIRKQICGKTGSMCVSVCILVV